MLTTDVLVGAVSIGLGGFVLAAGVFNWEWYYQLRKLNFAGRWGRGKARLVNVVLGLILILLGIAIAAGVGLNRSSPQGAARDSINAADDRHGPFKWTVNCPCASI